MKQPIIPKGDFFHLVFFMQCLSVNFFEEKTMKVTERFGKFSGFFYFIETQKW